MGTQIIIGIPGSWPTLDDIRDSVARKGSGFSLEDGRLLDSQSGQSWAAELHEHDQDLVTTFAISTNSWKDEDLERAIALHTYAVYLLSSELSLSAARSMLRAGKALLRAGGIAVKMESTGLVHSAEDWDEFCRDADDPIRVYSCFITLVKSDSSLYSCGMHNLGLPDASTDLDGDVDQAADIVNTFNCLQITDQTSHENGDTFRVTHAAPRYELNKTGCHYDDVDHPFHNPFGVWNLRRAPDFGEAVG
jgi:hypothetical protein